MKILGKMLLGALLAMNLTNVAMADSRTNNVYVTSPDKFAYDNISKYLPEESDTRKATVNNCYRRISNADFVQVVCTGTVEVLVFGGHPSKKAIFCLHNFKLNRDIGKYLTQRQPKCTR